MNRDHSIGRTSAIGRYESEEYHWAFVEESGIGKAQSLKALVTGDLAPDMAVVASGSLTADPSTWADYVAAVERVYGSRLTVTREFCDWRLSKAVRAFVEHGHKDCVPAQWRHLVEAEPPVADGSTAT